MRAFVRPTFSLITPLAFTTRENPPLEVQSHTDSTETAAHLVLYLTRRKFKHLVYAKICQRFVPALFAKHRSANAQVVQFYRDITCILLHAGMTWHETEIEKWEPSYFSCIRVSCVCKLAMSARLQCVSQPSYTFSTLFKPWPLTFTVFSHPACTPADKHWSVASEYLYQQ